MTIHDALHIGQSHAFARKFVRVMQPVKRLEEMLYALRLKTNAVINHHDPHKACVLRMGRLNLNTRSWILAGVLDCIADQIGEGLVKQAFMALNPGEFPHFERATLKGYGGLKLDKNTVQEFIQVDGLHLQFLMSQP